MTTLDFQLKSKQSAVFRALFYTPGVRFVTLVAGRRFGKTYIAVYALILAASSTTNAKVWYVAPTYKQAKEIAWDILKNMVPRAWVQQINESELTVKLRNGAKISLKGADNPDSLRGPELHFICFDEYADIDPSAWSAVIRPTLMTTKGRALFIGTPKGYNHFKELYDSSRSPYNDFAPLWRGFQYTSIEGGYIPDEEIAVARAETDMRIFRQEYEASFETLAGKVYYGFDRELSVRPCEDVGGDILVGMDFNVNPMTAVIGIRAVDELHIIDEVEISNSNTLEMAEEIKRRYGDRQANNKNYDLLKRLGHKEAIPIRPIKVYPDPSGRARKTSAPVGQTDYTILRKAGFDVIAPKRAPSVMDRLNNLNVLFHSSDKRRRCFIDPKCVKLIKCLDGLTYKEGTNQPDKGLGLDHLPDGLGYLAWSAFPVLLPKTASGSLYENTQRAN